MNAESIFCHSPWDLSPSDSSPFLFECLFATYTYTDCNLRFNRSFGSFQAEQDEGIDSGLILPTCLFIGSVYSDSFSVQDRSPGNEKMIFYHEAA